MLFLTNAKICLMMRAVVLNLFILIEVTIYCLLVVIHSGKRSRPGKLRWATEKSYRCKTPEGKHLSFSFLSFSFSADEGSFNLKPFSMQRCEIDIHVNILQKDFFKTCDMLLSVYCMKKILTRTRTLESKVSLHMI